jgi:hypothetical protein
MTRLTKTTITANMELIRASDDEVGDQDDYTNEDILILVSAFVTGDYVARYCIKIPCRISSLRGEVYIQELLSQAHPRRF